VQLRLPWRVAAEPVARTVTIDGRPLPVEIARHRRARRYVLRLTRTGSLRLTVPRGASIRAGLAFAERQAEWIRRERLRQSARDQPWQAGSLVWWRGVQVPLVEADGRIACGEVTLVPPDGRSIRAALEREFRRRATSELPPRLAALAAQHSATISRVTVRNQRSRWGACGPSGHITLNWRLLQMPPEVADYVMLHEITHLAHPHHRPRFWRAVAVVCPGWREAERWLREHGKQLL
jgi:predicted metal-dependent hydrolase